MPIAGVAPTGIRGRLRSAWSHLAAPEWLNLPVLTAGEQTRLSWARVVESCDQLPVAFRDCFAALFPGAEQRFPYTVLTPSHEGFLNRLSPKLISIQGADIYVLERTGVRVDSTCYPLRGITYLEIGTVLLKSWITLRGAAAGGVHSTTRLEFNTVNDLLFQPFVDQIRCAPRSEAQVDLDRERAKFDYLGPLHYKFMNYARRSLAPGESVRGCWVQAEVRRPVLRVLGKAFYRTVILSHLSILTDRELILIQDVDDPPAGSRATRYGGIWRFIPLDRIASASSAVDAAGDLACAIGLRDGDCLELKFQAENQVDLDRFMAALRNWIDLVDSAPA